MKQINTNLQGEKEIELTSWSWFFIVLFQLCWFVLPVWFIHDFYFSNSKLSKENPLAINAIIVAFILIVVYIIYNFFRFRKMIFIPSSLKLDEKVIIVESLKPVFHWARYKDNISDEVFRFYYWKK